MANERRRDYMVNRRVHALYMITWITSLLLVLGAVGTGYSLYKVAPQLRIEPIMGVQPLAVVGVLIFVVVAAALTLGVYAIIHTHRMLGSAYHIGMHLHRLNSGEPVGPLTLREGDYFQEVADEVNKLQERAKGAPPSPAAPPPAAS